MRAISKSMAGGLILIALASSCARDALSPSEAEALYIRRFDQYRAGNLSALYEPLESVAGSTHEQRLPLALPEQRTINPTALMHARDYARINNSTAFLVWRNGKLDAADYFGETTRETPLASLSLAKPLAVMAIGRALTLGRIKSLDQPVADFIPEWRGTPKDRILIRNLLQMESGLQPQDFNLDPATPMNRAYMSPFHEKVLIDDYQLTDPPGSRYAYSNATAELVAIIIERATGRRYASFLSDELIKPIGALGGTIWIDRPRGLAHSGCCIMLPAETWLKLGILVAQNGIWDGRRLLGGAFVQAMISPTPQNPHAGMMGIYVAGSYIERRGFSGPIEPGPKVLHGEPYAAADVVLFDGNSDQVLYIVRSANLVTLRMGSTPPKNPEWDNTKIPNILLGGIDWHGYPPTPQATQ